MKRNAVNSYLSVSGTIDVFAEIPHRLKYDAVVDDATQGVYLYRPPGMAHGSNTNSATVAWYIILDSNGIYQVCGAKCDETARDSRSLIATPVLCPLMFPSLL